MLVKLTTAVNFTKILEQLCSRFCFHKAVQNNFSFKRCSQKVGKIDSSSQFHQDLRAAFEQQLLHSYCFAKKLQSQSVIR